MNNKTDLHLTVPVFDLCWIEWVAEASSMETMAEQQMNSKLLSINISHCK